MAVLATLMLYLNQIVIINELCFSFIASLKQCFFRALDQKFPNLDTMIDVLSKIVCHVNELFTDQQTLNKTLRIRLSEQVSSSNV